jgi:hypothetical protein
MIFSLFLTVCRHYFARKLFRAEFDFGFFLQNSLALSLHSKSAAHFRQSIQKFNSFLTLTWRPKRRSKISQKITWLVSTNTTIVTRAEFFFVYMSCLFFQSFSIFRFIFVYSHHTLLFSVTFYQSVINLWSWTKNFIKFNGMVKETEIKKIRNIELCFVPRWFGISEYL